jgi:hypothetical protein
LFLQLRRQEEAISFGKITNLPPFGGKLVIQGRNKSSKGKITRPLSVTLTSSFRFSKSKGKVAFDRKSCFFEENHKNKSYFFVEKEENPNEAPNSNKKYG